MATFEIIIDDKNFGAASCIALAVAFSERGTRWQNCSASTVENITCLVNIIGGMTCINSA